MLENCFINRKRNICWGSGVEWSTLHIPRSEPTNVWSIRKSLAIVLLFSSACVRIYVAVIYEIRIDFVADCCFAVQVPKGPRGLGLSVSGGVDTNAAFPGLIRIKRLFPNQSAWCTGMLQPGDILLEANGAPLTGLTNHVIWFSTVIYSQQSFGSFSNRLRTINLRIS